jgi:signal transduction histidine kinase
LSNAVKFTSHGGVRVLLGVEGRASDHIDLHLAVADSGIGMTEDQVARVFDRFQQADTSTTRRCGGTGLGLSIVAQLVDLMGGRVWIDSMPGVGSTFHMTCTLDVPGPAAAGAPPPQPRADQYVGIEGSTSSA